MRTLSLAPISGRRHPAGPMLMWVGPSVLAHVIVIALSGFRLTTTAEPESHPIIEAIFLAPLLPREDAHVPADATNGPGGTPFGWTDYTSVATADGDGGAGAAGRSHSSGLATANGPVMTADSVATPAVGDEHVYQAVDVDREVTREADAAAPIYPEELRTTNVQGAVTVEFVVDTAGRVEGGSLHVIGTTHPLFASAVRAASTGMHFRPAVRGGQLVRQQVIQSFQFVLQQPTVQAASAGKVPRDTTKLP